MKTTLNAILHAERSLITGKRNSGKTTFLFDIANYLQGQMEVFIIDSATWHKSKSLIYKINESFKDNVCVWSTYKKKKFHTFIDETKQSIKCFDVAHDLEIAHLIKERAKRQTNKIQILSDESRAKYRRVATEILLFLLNRPYTSTCCILLDEIELDARIIKKSNFISNKCKLYPKYIFSSLHPETLQTEKDRFYEDFSIINLQDRSAIYCAE